MYNYQALLHSHLQSGVFFYLKGPYDDCQMSLYVVDPFQGVDFWRKFLKKFCFEEKNSETS